MRVNNNIKEFAKLSDDAMDRVLNRMAIDVERQSKQNAPVLTGRLRSSGKHYRNGEMNYKVEFDVEYAKFVELGTKYQKERRFLTQAGDNVKAGSINYIKAEAGSIRL
jgi:HK97 gp10 family phage protein